MKAGRVTPIESQSAESPGIRVGLGDCLDQDVEYIECANAALIAAIKLFRFVYGRRTAVATMTVANAQKGNISAALAAASTDAGGSQ